MRPPLVFWPGTDWPSGGARASSRRATARGSRCTRSRRRRSEARNPPGRRRASGLEAAASEVEAHDLGHVEVSQPNALSSGTTQVVEQTTVQAQDKPVNRIDLKEGATVEDLVEELQLPEQEPGT